MSSIGDMADSHVLIIRVSHGEHGEGMLTCDHPGCAGAEGVFSYFATIEQFVAHWNTFHGAHAVGCTCPVVGCSTNILPSPDALKGFIHHLQCQHVLVHASGRWPHISAMLQQGHFVGPNLIYWPVMDSIIRVAEGWLSSVSPPQRPRERPQFCPLYGPADSHVTDGYHQGPALATSKKGWKTKHHD